MNTISDNNKYWNTPALSVFVLAVFFCWLNPVKAQTQLQDYPTLSRQFSPDKQPASYVIVIDMSGSMKTNGYFLVVRRAVSSFISSLPTGDYLSILGFNRTTSRLIVPQRLQDNREDLIKLVDSLPEPTPKQPTAPEQYTDIGKALEETIQELRAPEAPRLQFVFFMTDGIHDPSPDSKYPKNKEQLKISPAWKELQNTAKLALSEKLLQPFAVSLGRQTDADLVQDIFPEAMPIPVNDNTSLAAFFARIKSEMLRDRMKLLVADELRQNRLATITPPRLSLISGKTSRVIIQMPKMFSKLDSTISTRTVSSSKCVFTELDGEKTLPADIGFSLRTTGNTHFWQIQQTIPCEYQIHFDVMAEPRAEIMRLGLDPSSSRDLIVQGEVVSGQPIWVLASSVILLLLLVLLVLRQIFTASLPPSLCGRLVCIEGPGNLPFDKMLQRHQNITIGGTEKDTIRLEYETQSALVTLRAEREPESWALRLLHWNIKSSQWILSTGSVIIRDPEPVIDPIANPEPDSDANGIVDFNAPPIQDFDRKAKRKSRKTIEREGVIGKRWLTNGILIEIGSYTFRWDEYYDPKEEVSGKSATNEWA